jgi:hypothetical protein
MIFFSPAGKTLGAGMEPCAQDPVTFYDQPAAVLPEALSTWHNENCVFYGYVPDEEESIVLNPVRGKFTAFGALLKMFGPEYEIVDMPPVRDEVLPSGKHIIEHFYRVQRRH